VGLGPRSLGGKGGGVCVSFRLRKDDFMSRNERGRLDDGNGGGSSCSYEELVEEGGEVIEGDVGGAAS